MPKKAYVHELDKDEEELVARLAANHFKRPIADVVERAYTRGYETCEQKHRDAERSLKNCLCLLETCLWPRFEKVVFMTPDEVVEAVGKDGYERLLKGERVEKPRTGYIYVDMYVNARKVRDAD